MYVVCEVLQMDPLMCVHIWMVRSVDSLYYIVCLYPHPSHTTTSHRASLSPTFYGAAARMATALGQAETASQCTALQALTAADFMDSLFTGDFFAYGSQLDGSGRRDDIMFNGQSAGQFLSRVAMWSDGGVPFNATISAVAAQLRTSVALSHGFYSPKVFK